MLKSWMVCLLFLSGKEAIPWQTNKNFTGRVVAVKDGDTFDVMYKGKAQTIRLAHIDCPENGQPYGKQAKQFASTLCFGKEVRVVATNQKDRYKRLIAVVYMTDSININQELVKAGMAWHFKQYSTDSSYYQLEQTARKNKTGLWQDKNASPPWLWRKPKRK
jgi:micrococcal nuclease